MALFDTDGDGTVNFDEFLVGIRVSNNSNPIQLLSPSPLAIAKSREGVLAPSFILGSFQN